MGGRSRLVDRPSVQPGDLLARDASWPVAAERPPHLAAIVPWEGASDAYREFNDAWYRERTPDLEKIEIPVLAVGNWGSLHLHQRGIPEGFGRVGSSVRQLVISSGTHIGPFYELWAKERQLRFLDRWLKDEANDGERAFVFVAESEVEFTGPMAARLWVSSTGHNLDVFLHFQVVDCSGAIRLGVGPQGAPIPLAMGWLRASHRALDLVRSRPYRPVHLHAAASALIPGEPVPLDVEIWPTSITLAAGERFDSALLVPLIGPQVVYSGAGAIKVKASPLSE